MKSTLMVVLLLACMAGISQTTFEFSDSAVLSRLSRDVHILASDSFAGRKYGSDGERIASGYIIRSFKEAGLIPPGGNDSSFLQPFPIKSIRIPRTSNTMIIEGFNNPLYVQHDFSPTAYSGNGREEGHNYLLIDLARYGTPGQIKMGETGHSVRQAVQHAFQQGYNAVLLSNEGKLNGSEADSLYDRMHVKPENGLVVSVNSDIAIYLLSHPDANISLSVDIKRTSTICNNVVGVINHEAPHTIIIGAHYDHLGLNSKRKVFNGADDNASGTATMMELSRYLKQCGDSSNNYLFIAFSGEEEGLLGSGYFVKHPLVCLQSINFMVNLDMVGRLGCEGNRIIAFGTGSSPSWRKVYKETAHPGFRLSRANGVHNFSDHLDFYRHQIPIISLTTGFHYDYHTTHDDASTINYTGMVDIVKYLEGLLRNVSAIGMVGYQNVSGYANFSANFKIVIAGIDHLLSVGSDE